MAIAGSVLDQFWECPKCGTQVAMGAPARMRPPKCSWGHPATEMEQSAAPRFGRAFDEAGAGES
jgi:ribosomal protein L37AE/L43A